MRIKEKMIVGNIIMIPAITRRDLYDFLIFLTINPVKKSVIKIT